MGKIEIRGIIFSKNRYHNSSVIVNVFTAAGTMQGIAYKGALAPKKGYCISSQLVNFAIIDFILMENIERDVQLGLSAQIVEDFGISNEDYEVQLLVAKIIDKCKVFIKPGEEFPKLYELLLAFLRNFLHLKKIGLDAAYFAFMLKLLSIAGFRPSFEKCACCGGELSGQKRFSPSEGGVLCGNCEHSIDAFSISDLTIELCTYVLKTRFANFERDYFRDEVVKSAVRMIDSFYVQHLT